MAPSSPSTAAGRPNCGPPQSLPGLPAYAASLLELPPATELGDGPCQSCTRSSPSPDDWPPLADGNRCGQKNGGTLSSMCVTTHLPNGCSLGQVSVRCHRSSQADANIPRVGTHFAAASGRGPARRDLMTHTSRCPRPPNRPAISRGSATGQIRDVLYGGGGGGGGVVSTPFWTVGPRFAGDKKWFHQWSWWW